MVREHVRCWHMPEALIIGSPPKRDNLQHMSFSQSLSLHSCFSVVIRNKCKNLPGKRKKKKKKEPYVSWDWPPPLCDPATISRISDNCMKHCYFSCISVSSTSGQGSSLDLGLLKSSCCLVLCMPGFFFSVCLTRMFFLCSQ